MLERGKIRNRESEKQDGIEINEETNLRTRFTRVRQILMLNKNIFNKKIPSLYI